MRTAARHAAAHSAKLPADPACGYRDTLHCANVRCRRCGGRGWFGVGCPECGRRRGRRRGRGIGASLASLGRSILVRLLYFVGLGVALTAIVVVASIAVSGGADDIGRMSSGFDRRAVEDHIHDRVNAVRATQGLGSVARDPGVDALAYSHAADMDAREYYSHNSPEGITPMDRGLAAGHACYRSDGSYGIAENIASSYTYSSAVSLWWLPKYDWLDGEDGVAADLMDMWLTSPGHRQNILNPYHNSLGVGVAIGGDESVLAVQNFC